MYPTMFDIFVKHSTPEFQSNHLIDINLTITCEDPDNFASINIIF